MRAHNTIHHREVAKMLKTPPQHFSSRLVWATAANKTAELRKPMDRFTQRRWLVRRDCDMMNGTIERLPFIRLQQHAARRLRHRTRQHGGIINPPRQDAVKGQTALQAIRRGKLARFKAAATFQNPMPHLNSPAARVPLHAFDGLFDAGHGHRGEQQPLDSLDLVGGSISRTSTTHSFTVGNPSRFRCCGGARVKAL